MSAPGWFSYSSRSKPSDGDNGVALDKLVIIPPMFHEPRGKESSSIAASPIL